MRSLFVAPIFAVAALAQSPEEPGSEPTPSVTGSSSSYSYSNTLTWFTTLTDSRGVVTGMPTPDASTPDQPALETDVGTLPTLPTLPSGHTVVNSVPAGLPTGIQTVTLGNETITASINNSTTVIVSATSGSTGARDSSPTTTSGSGSDDEDEDDGTDSDSSASGSDGSASSTSTSEGAAAAATHIQLAGGALIGAAGFVAALL